MPPLPRHARRGVPFGFALAVVLAAVSGARAQESWDAIYAGGAKIGHTHVRVEPVKDRQGRPLMRVLVNWVVEFERGNDKAKIELIYGTIETPDGSVLKLDTHTKSLDAKTGQVVSDLRTSGEVREGVMTLVLEGGGNKRESRMPWGPEVRGPYGAELSLSRQPLKPGESRVVKTYIPDLNKVCLTKLDAKGVEAVPLGPSAEPRSLLRVESTVSDLDGKPLKEMNATLWVEADGQIMKSRTDLLGGIETFRTTKEGALAKGGPGFKLLEKSVIQTKLIPDADKRRAIVYRVATGADDPAAVFPADGRQAVRPGAAKGSGVLEVRVDAPPAGKGESAEVDGQYTRPNPLINSDDPYIVELARKAVGNRTDPWDKAVAIEQWVFKNLNKKNFSTAFASAHDTARSLSGDCTEHGVLTAALCRAAGVPTRCVVGLVYADNIGGKGIHGFGPHLWNEVYVRGQWVALDATFNQSQVDPTHIKLAETSLDGAAPFEAFLPVLKVFQGMKVEPVEIR